MKKNYKTRLVGFILFILLTLTFSFFLIVAFTHNYPHLRTVKIVKPIVFIDNGIKGCVFKTVFEDEFLDSNFLVVTTQKVQTSVENGLRFMAKSQHENGGWGAGSHSNQREMNPYAVPTDPATTSMVAMALPTSFTLYVI